VIAAGCAWLEYVAVAYPAAVLLTLVLWILIVGGKRDDR
jgi:hypothetical protein